MKKIKFRLPTLAGVAGWATYLSHRDGFSWRIIAAAVLSLAVIEVILWALRTETADAYQKGFQEGRHNALNNLASMTKDERDRYFALQDDINQAASNGGGIVYIKTGVIKIP